MWWESAVAVACFESSKDAWFFPTISTKTGRRAWTCQATAVGYGFFLLNSAKSFPFKSRLYSSVQNVKPHVPSYIPKHHLHVGKQTAPLCIFLNKVVSGSVPREIGGFFLLRFQSVGFTLNGSGEKMVGLKLKNGPKAWRVAPEIHETVRS